MLASEEMKNKILISINKLEDIKTYKLEGISTFLLPLKGYSVGYPASFMVEEINRVASNENVYCLINKVLNNKEIDELIISTVIINQLMYGLIMLIVSLFLMS